MLRFEACEFLPENCYDSVRALLRSCADEFVPPLSWSKLSSSSHKSSSRVDNIELYFRIMSAEAYVLALDDDVLVGFLAYIPQYGLTGLSVSGVCSYVTTICVAKNRRGEGIAHRMYEEVEREVKMRHIVVRTWSTNMAHVSVLLDRGYVLLERFENDRGEGVDTVYYIKELSSR